MARAQGKGIRFVIFTAQPCIALIWCDHVRIFFKKPFKIIHVNFNVYVAHI
jgi:hypothetical protein